MKQLRTYWPLVVFGVLLINYLIWGRALAGSVIAGKAPDWVQTLADAFYHRLSAERNRLDLNYLLRKADQVLLRLGFVMLAGSLLVWSVRRNPAFRRKLHAPVLYELSNKRMVLLQGICMLGLVSFCFTWGTDYEAYEKLSGFYQPVGLLSVLHAEFPTAAILYWCHVLMLAMAVMIAFNLQKKLSGRAWLAYLPLFLLYLYLQAFFFSFEKTDHRFAPLFWLLLSLLIWSFRPAGPANNGQWLGVARIALAGQYLLSGLEKVFTSGPQWASAETLRVHILNSQVPAGMAIVEMDWLLSLLAIGTAVLQLGFISQLWWPGSRWLWIGGALAFHLGSWLLLDIGDPLSPWVFGLLFFGPWETKAATRVPARDGDGHLH